MNEIEVKILDIDPAEIRKRLKKLGAKKAFDGKIEASFYDFPDGSVKKAGNHIRLRKFGSQKVELTFKRLVSKKKYKHNEEIDITVNDFKAADSFLRMLGLEKSKAYSKRRERYVLKGFKYEIDKYPKIPAFVEIEAKSESRKNAVRGLEKAVRLLGYKMKDTVPWNGFEVLRHYNQKI